MLRTSFNAFGVAFAGITNFGLSIPDLDYFLRAFFGAESAAYTFIGVHGYVFAHGNGPVWTYFCADPAKNAEMIFVHKVAVFIVGFDVDPCPGRSIFSFFVGGAYLGTELASDA